MLEQYPKEVKLVIKNFPLQSHSFSKQAAAAALAAHQQGKFWEFHNKIFENQNALNDARIQDIAKGLGLNMDKFNKDITDSALQNLINRDLNEGVRAGVPGTPTIFVNGKLLKSRGPQGIQQMIEAELKKGKLN